MKTATQRKPPISIPTLRERVSALLEQLLEAPAEEQREILMGWRNMLDAALDDLAEERRPKGENGIPTPWIKLQMHARGHGECPCRAMSEALKDA